MSEVMINKLPWQQLAERLFLDEFEEPKVFYESFSEPSSVYHELARRVTQKAINIEITPDATTLGSTPSVFLREAIASSQQVVESAAYKVMTGAINKDAETGGREHLMILAEIYETLI